jgi:branched-chain amino acid transport system substrate-binding protein
MLSKQTWARWAARVVLGMGVVLAQGVSAQDIVIGQVGPFTGIPVPDAPEVNQGLKAWAAQINKAGGINGRKVVVFEIDDTYKPDGFVSALERAMQRQPVALISPIGSASIQRMLNDKLLDKYDVVFMNAIPGAEPFRNPGHPKLFHVRAGDKQQLEEIVKHASTLGMTRLAVLHQEIPIGTSGMKVVADEVAKNKGLEVKGVQGTLDPAVLVKAAADVAKLNAQGVIVVGAPPFMAQGVAQLRKAGVTQTIFVLSYVPPGLLVKLAGADGARGIGIAQTFPNPNNKVRPLLRDFQSAMKVTSPEVSSYTPFQLEGYISARIVGEGLRRIRGEITPAALAKSLQSMGEVELGGFRVDFSKGNVGSSFVDIAVVDQEGRLRY